MSFEASRQFDVKERKHKEQLKKSLSYALASDLLRVLQEELEADVTLHSHAGSLRAHRAVLLARAPHIFHKLSQKDPVTVIHLPEYKLPGLKDYLRHVYTADQSMYPSDSPPQFKATNLQNTPAADRADPCGSSDSDAVVLETASGLGADMLALYQRGEQCDTTIHVEEQVFSCHRAVLCARSEYFRAMLSGNWKESSGHSITLQGLGPDEMEIVLQFIYGAIVDLPSGANASQVVLAGNMLLLEGLKDVVEMILIRDYCRFFPKPIGGVKKTIPECLSLTHALGLQSLHTLCKRWIAGHFVQVWGERNFSFLPVELQRACFTAVAETITVQNVVTILCQSEHLICSLPEVKWAQKVMELATELQEEALQVIIQNLSKVIHTQPFQDFRAREAITREPLLLRKLCSAIADRVTVDNCCYLFTAVNLVCGDESDKATVLEQQEQKPEEPFRQEFCMLRGRLWTFQVQSFYAIRHTTGWEALSSRHQEKILADALDEGDSRRLCKKPILTSSKLKPVRCPLPASESFPLHKNSRFVVKRSCTSVNKLNGQVTSNKPGDSPASKAKSTKKPEEKAKAGTAETASSSMPIVKVTRAARDRPDAASTSGPKSFVGGKEQEKKPNPGIRPKMCHPSRTFSSQTTGMKAQKSSARKVHNSTGTSPAPPPNSAAPRQRTELVAPTPLQRQGPNRENP
ncbi:unnamed protein product [Ophioblennius macclurei]